MSLFQASDIFSTFPESLYNHPSASNGISSKDSDNINGQPIPASIRPKPSASAQSLGLALGSGSDEKSSEMIRVRSPQTLQRVAFDVATLRQSSASASSFKKSSAKNDDDDENVDSVNVSNESEPASLTRAEPRKAETLVA